MLSPTKPYSERKTIAVFASQVGREWGAEFIVGVTRAAEENNVNLVHFIGGKIAPIKGPEAGASHPMDCTTLPNPINSMDCC